MQYIFILGNHSGLAANEIASVFDSEGVSFDVLKIFGNVMLVKCPEKLTLDFFEKLGGTIKVAEVLGENLAEEDLLKDLKSIDIAKKLCFGFSLHSFTKGISKKKLKGISKDFYRDGLSLKKALRQEKISSRLVTSQTTDLSSVIVKKNGLLESGRDYVVLLDEKLIIGKTIWVQDFEKFSKRDYDRPQADAISGMLPPKLAKMMVNLSQVKQNQVFLDPFCGSGTVIQEAALLGVRKLLASDLEEKAVFSVDENFKWLEKTFLKKNYFDLKTKVLDVRKLSSYWGEGSVDAIATEPFLGPPLKKRLTQAEAARSMDALEMLYEDAFSEFYKVLRPGGKVVFTFPVMYLGEAPYEQEVLEKNKNDFAWVNLERILNKQFKRILPEIGNNNLDFHKQRKSFIYGRERQKVLREIIVVEKV